MFKQIGKINFNSYLFAYLSCGWCLAMPPLRIIYNGRIITYSIGETAVSSSMTCVSVKGEATRLILEDVEAHRRPLQTFYTNFDGGWPERVG